MAAPGGRRASHATTACDQCFRWKVRCDGASPSCASCDRLQQRCTYLRPDKRKISKIAVGQLLDRIRMLENTLKEHHIPTPSPPPPQLRCSPAGPSENGPDASEILASGEWSTMSLLADPTDSQVGEGDDRERALIERMDQGNALTPGLDPDIELLVKRTGSLQFAEHGQLKYFGTTSNVHFLKTGIPFQPRIQRDTLGDSTLGDSPQAWLDRAGVGHAVPRELEDHLIKLYFTWENGYFNVVDQDAFMHARRRALSGSPCDKSSTASCYSELLVNAMCTWGALFTDRIIPEIPGSLHDFFILRARSLLERDIDNPTIATVQALAMLSGSEASRGRDSRGWLYDSMAAGLAHHLGLHLDVEHYVRSNDMSRQEANVRSTAFWGTYVIDTAWSYYLGRLTMPVAGANRVPVRSPAENQTAPRFWEDYTDESAEFRLPLQRYVEPLASMWEHQLRLCYIMERLQKTFYDKHTGSISQLRVHTFAVTCSLDKWLSELPPELVVDPNDTAGVYLPHVLVLHGQFHETMIFANHPFITTPRTGQSPDSRRRYVESARAITRLIGIYKRLWTLRRINIMGIHPMFTAAMVHLYIACTSQSQEEYTLAVSHLESCCDAIKDASKSFELAAWQLRSVHRVCQLWHELLENQTHGPPRTAAQQSGPETGPPGCARWAAIEAAIQKAMVSTEIDPAAGEQFPWFNTWVQMQEISGVDPFSMGSA